MPDGSWIDPWRFMRIAGHASIKMSLKYVHADQSSVVKLMEGHAEVMEALQQTYSSKVQ